MTGIQSSALPTAQTAEEVIALRSLAAGVYETVRMPMTAVTDAAVAAASAALAPAIDGAAAGSILAASWSALAATTGSRAGQPATVPTSDVGTHADPVVGGVVANSGDYAWSTSPAGWRRVRASPWTSVEAAQAALSASVSTVSASVSAAGVGAAQWQGAAPGAPQRLPDASLDLERQGLLAPVMLGQQLVGGYDAEGYSLARRREDGVRIPAQDGPAPHLGVLFRDGSFAGVDEAGRVHGDIGPAYERMGRQPVSPAAPDAAWALTDRDGAALRGLSHDGAPMDVLAALAPALRSEWLTEDLLPAAPEAPGARELIVAYMPSGERRVLTPWSHAYHWRCPTLAYYGRSVRAWRAPVAGGAGEWRAVTIDGDGTNMPDDPLVAHVVWSDGQSLAQGSGGGLDYPRRAPTWPSHTLTIDNAVKPGDIRLGRDASATAFAIDPATLGDFVAIQPQTGVATVHNYTALEAFLETLQQRLVSKLGRPQRLIGFVLGVGGNTIAQIGVGSQNEANLRIAIARVVTLCAARGWRPSFDGCLWLHGESNAAGDTAAYMADVRSYKASTDDFITGLTGQTQPVRWMLSQASSTAESVDDELTKVGVLAFPDMMRAAPDEFRVVGPHYPYQAHYVDADYVHLANMGYFRLGEHAHWAAAGWVWGGAPDDPPLYPLSAVASGATITVTWSRPLVVDAAGAPARPFWGLEVSSAANTLVTPASHIVNNGSAVTTVTLAAPLATLTTARLHVGMAAQATPRDAGSVPGTNLRGVAALGRSEWDDAPIHAWAIHDRIPITAA